MRNLAWVLIVAGLLMVALPVRADAVVGDGTPESCDGVALVTALTAGGLITFDCGGPLTITLDETLEIALDTTIDGASEITLDGGGLVRLIRHTAGTLTLRNLTLSNGAAEGIDEEANGAAVQSIFQGTAPTLNIENATFTDNISTLTDFSGSAYDYGGGAVYSQGGYLNISGSSFTGNHANNGAGGAVHVLRSDVSISGSSFSDNSALGAGQGGAIYIDGARPTNGLVTITSSTFTANTAHNQGGAIYVHLYQNNDAFIVERSAFIGNGVVDGSIGLGGAISGGNGRVEISGSLFANNYVDRPEDADGSGGAVAFAERALITIVNSTFTGNRAEGLTTNANGGALYIVNNTQPFRIINSTIAYNFAGWVGGGISSTTNGILQNTLIAHNTADNGINAWGIQQQCSARLTNGGHNIQFPDRNPNPNFFNEVVCASGILVANPLLAPLADNGGPTQTLALMLGSPAIDTGSNLICADAPVNNLDQRGFVRPVDGNGNPDETCDIGAFEYYPDITPFMPLLLTPANNAALTGLSTTFSWQRAPFAAFYRFQVDDDPAFGSPLIEFETTALSFTPGLLLDGTYYWRLLAVNPNGETASMTRVFTLASAAGDKPIRNLYDTATPTLTWGAVDWATGYELQLADNPAFSTPIVSINTLNASTFEFTTPLLKDGIYYWRIRAQRSNGSWGAWSVAEAFAALSNTY